MKTVLQCVTVLSAFVAHSTSTYTVTIYPQILSQGGRTQFEKDRWNSHNGLDPENFIANNLDVGSRTGRWLNPDLNSDIFVNVSYFCLRLMGEGVGTMPVYPCLTPSTHAFTHSLTQDRPYYKCICIFI